MAKDLHFNKNMEALKKMQAGADKLATVVGVTIGPKVSAGSSAAGQSAGERRTNLRAGPIPDCARVGAPTHAGIGQLRSTDVTRECPVGSNCAPAWNHGSVA